MHSDKLMKNIDNMLEVDSFGTEEENLVDAIFNEVDSEMTGSVEESEAVVATPKQTYPSVVVDKVASSDQYKIENDDILNDYRQVRSNLQKMITDGLEASAELKNIALDSEHHRAYYALEKMLTITNEMNKDLLNVHARMKYIENYGVKKNAGVNVNNAVFVGTLDDLLKGINQVEENIEGEIENEIKPEFP